MDLSKLTSGKNVPEEINVVIEIPHGSSIKYQMDEESGVIFVDRFVPPAMYFPINYGFIPHIKGGDGDAIDVLVLTSQPVHPGTVIPCRPIGILEMEDEDGIDTKIVAVPMPKVDYFYREVTDISDLNKIQKAQIKHFFDHYKDMEEGKWVKTGEFLGKEAAYEVIKKSMNK